MELKDMTQEQFTELLQNTAKEAVATYVKDSGLDKIDQKYVVIPEVDEKKQLAQKQSERFGNLAKAIMNKQFVMADSLNTEIKTADPNNMTTDADGGYLVPNETAAEIVGLIPTYGQSREVITPGTFPLKRDTITIPKRSTGMSVYYPGEQGSITSSKLALTYMTLTAKKAAAIAVLTNELKDFATVDFVNYIKTRAAEAFATDEDSKVFGIVNTVFAGLFYASNSFGKVETAAVTDITYNNLKAMKYGLDQKYLASAKWIMHRSLLEMVEDIKDTTGRPIFQDANAGQLPNLMGYPVKLIEAAPSADSVSGTPVILLGNFNNSTLQDKQGMRIDVSGEAYVDASSMFQTDMTALRFIRHWTFDPGFVEAYSALKVA